MNDYSVFTSVGIFFISADTIKQALRKFISIYGYKPDAVYPGKFIY